jgi:hypothetical protein
MAGTRPAMTPGQEPACAGEPLFFPGLRGRAAGGHPRSLRPSPVRGKTTQPLALPPYGITALFAADGAGKGPGMRMDNAPARRVGAALACPLTGHKSKGRAKGGYGINAPLLGIRAAAGEGK